MRKTLFLVIILITTSCAVKITESSVKKINPYKTKSITITSFPVNYQLYARNAKNKASVEVSGNTNSSLDSVVVKLLKNNIVIKRIVSKAQNSFSFNIEIEALLNNYTIELYAKESIGKESLIRRATHITAGDVYVINGQSNAWSIDYDNKYNKQNLPNSTQWVRTIGAMHVYNKRAILPQAKNINWFLASGKAPDIRKGAQLVGNGMVGVLGMKLGINLVESENVPIAIINGAGGGGAISFYQKKRHNDLNSPYGRLQFRLEKSGLKNHIKAFIWNQGENNAGDETLTYKTQLNQLYISFKKDFTFEKFYVIQTPPGCNSVSGHQTIREAQRQFVEEHEGVSILTRHGFSFSLNKLNKNYFLSDGCHYHAHGYEMLANWISNLARYDFYGKNQSYEAPKIISVQLKSSTALVIEFDKQVLIQSDIEVDKVLYSVKEHSFSINGNKKIAITSLKLQPGNKKIELTFLSQKIKVGDKLTYILGDNYPFSSTPFIGPWIVDAYTGVGAVGFTKEIK